MTLPSSNAALAPKRGRATPLPLLSLCAVTTLSRQLLQVLPVDYCCLLVLGILKNMELPGGFLLQPSSHHAATAERVTMPSGAATFSLCLLPCSVQTPASGVAC